jgi:hypothetical protein
MSAKEDAEMKGVDAKLPGPIAIWQAIATGFAGMLLTSVIATNKLEARRTQHFRSAQHHCLAG